MADLLVLAQDPRFGGGASAQTDAFVAGARALGRDPELAWAPHPTFDGRRLTVDRVEALRQLRGGRRLAPRAKAARDLWAATTIATNAYAAPLSGRPYRLWLGTSLDDEWGARARGLDPLRRLSDRLNAPVLRRLERRVIAGAERVYATSPASRDAVAGAGGIDAASVGILPIPVDVEAFAPAEAPPSGALPVLAFVGRADDPRKNVRLLYDALPRIPEATVRLVGRAPGAVPPRVEALGVVPSVAAALRGATLLVVPSWQEGFGIVASEALAAGVPVVTTPCGGPEHLVRASGGGVVLGSFEPEELAATVNDLLGDAARLAAMRRDGRAYVVREHSPERFRALLAEAL